MKREFRQAWRSNLIEIEPYVPGEQISAPGLIKLNTNENPYPPSPKVAEALSDFSVDALRKYPDGGSGALTAALAAYHRLPKDMVYVGNGSDEVLAVAFRACFCGDDPVLFPDITYSFYPVWCRLFQIPFQEIPLDGAFCISPRGFHRPNGGIVLTNPNAPVGIGVGQSFVEDLLEANRSSVVIADEAYAAFGGYSAVGLLEKYENLLIVNTFSKSRSLAGMRIGYALGSPPLIRALEAVRDAFNSYPLNMIAQVAGVASLSDESYYQERVRAIVETREESVKTLKALGFHMTESLSNFLFITHPEADAKDLYEYLKANNILVRWWAKPRIRDYLRVTVGTGEEMAVLMEKMRQFLIRKAKD